MFRSRIKIQKLTLQIGLLALFLFYFTGYSNSQINLGLVGMLGFTDHIECLEIYKNEYNINGYNNIYAFCGTGRGLTIIDVTDPNSPEIVTQLDLGKIVAIEFFEMRDGPNNGSKDFVVILNTRNDLIFLCIEDPERPGFAGRYSILRRPDAPLVINKQDLVVSREYLYVADGYASLDIIDISDPYEPQYAGRFDTPGKAQAIYIEGDYAYVADGPDGFVIIDISNPTDTFYVGGLNLTKLKERSKPTVGPRDIVVKGPYAYLACDDFGLFVFNITNKAQPLQVKEYNLAGNNTNIDATHINLATFGNYAYMAHYDGLTIIDVNDPNDEGKYIDLHSGAYDIAICEDYAYVIDIGKKGITIFRIQDPISPEPRGNLLVLGDAQRIALHNEYAYVLDAERGMLEISVNDVSKPELEAICLSNKEINDITIHGDIAYVPAERKGIALIDLEGSSRPARYYNNNISKAVSITVDEDGRYAYVADNYQKTIVVLDISNLDINDSQKPLFVGSSDTEGKPIRVKVQGNYIYVCEDEGLEIFDVNNPGSPERTGILKTFKDNEGGKTLANAIDLDISGNYAYMAARDDGVIIADISDSYNPLFISSYYTQRARGIEISYPYAYIADQKSGVLVLDITNPWMPLLAEDVKKTGISFEGMDLQIKGEYLYVAARFDGLIIFRILDTPPLQGNLILCTGGPFNSVNPLWPPSQALSNKIFSVFQDASYPHYFVYYFNPNPFQDLDGDRFLDPFIVDDFDSMQGDLKFSLTEWAGTRLNTGPLYLYLTGLGTEDAFMISPGEIIKASDPYDPDNMNTLKQFLDTFQKANPDRDVICLLEFASSGSLCDDLIDSNTIPYSRTVITCTDTETSYLDPNGRNAFTSHLITLLQDSGQEGLFSKTGISSHQRVGLLQGLFSQARKGFWEQGYPFNTQPPKMVSAQGAHTLCSLSLSVDPLVSDVTDTDIPTITSTYPDHTLAFIPTGHYPDGNFVLNPGEVYFQSSDPSILLVTDQGLAFANPNTNYNGNATVLATIIDPNFTQAQGNDTDNPLGGVTGCIRVNVKIPGREEKESLPMAIIVAGEKEEGDYLWEETHTIANYAYTTLLNRGYSRENIIYLTHYRKETEGNEDTDLDGDGDPDNDIDGVPNLHNLREALYRVEEKGAKKLILFMVDHGIKKGDNRSPEGGFFLSSPDKDPNNPQKDSNSILNPLELDHWLDILQGRIKDLEITIIVESCHSGLFIDSLKDEKRVIITSTMEDESYLYANGLVSFSYYLFSLLQSGASMTTAYNGALYSLLEIDRFLHTQREALNEPHQKPQLWSQPKSLAHSTAIGGPFLISQDQPIISSSGIVPDPNDSSYDPNTIKTGQDVLISVEASDMDGIDELWAMVNATYNPSTFSEDYDHPVVDLPRIDFDKVIGENEYKTDYPGFDFEGPYSLLIFARDTKGIVSLPYYHSFYVSGHENEETKNKAILVAGYVPNTDFDPLIKYAEGVLRDRRFTDIKRLDNQNNKKYELEQLITNLGQPPTSQLLIYFIGQTIKQEDVSVCFQLTETECLDPNTFNGWLEGLHSTLILLLDTSVLPDTNIPQGSTNDQTFFQPGQNRINITGSIQGTPYWEDGGYCSFSHFFFTCLMQGASIYQAYRSAQFAIDYYSEQKPAFEDVWGNELAKATYIGSPFQAKAKSGIIVPSDSIVCGETKLSVQAENADPNANAWCLITTPSGETHEIELSYIEGQNLFEDIYHVEDTGMYEVVTFFQDPNGIIDFGVTNYTMVTIGEDPYENDDDPNRATPMIINYSYARPSEPDHTFHNPNDEDWIVFHAYPDRNYEIKVDLKSAWEGCLLKASLYNQYGEKLLDTDDLYFSEDKEEFLIESDPNTLPNAGYYFLKFFYGCTDIPEGACPVYRIKEITDGCAGNTGNIRGLVRHGEKHVVMPGIKVYAEKITGPGGIFEKITDNKTNIGEFRFYDLKAGEYLVYALSDNSHKSEEALVCVHQNSTENINLFLDSDIQTHQTANNPVIPLKYYTDYWSVTFHTGMNLFSCPCKTDNYDISDLLIDAYDLVNDANSIVNKYYKENDLPDYFYMDIRRCIPGMSQEEKTLWEVRGIDSSRSVYGNTLPLMPCTGYLVYLDIHFADQGIQSISLQIPCYARPERGIITCDNSDQIHSRLSPGLNLRGINFPDPESDSELFLNDPQLKDIETFLHYVPDKGSFKTHYRFFERPSGNHCRFFKDTGYLIFKNK